MPPRPPQSARPKWGWPGRRYKRPPPDLPTEERTRLIREHIATKGITRCPSTPFNEPRKDRKDG